MYKQLLQQFICFIRYDKSLLAQQCILHRTLHAGVAKRQKKGL